MLSILIPAYNYNILPLAAEMQRQCIEAGITFEIIGLDDASGSEHNAENNKINLLTGSSFAELAQNMGRTAIRNLLAQKAKYNRLLFMDADVMPASAQYTEKYLPFLQKPNVKLVFGGYAYVKGDHSQKELLRYRYGIAREEKTAVERAKNPYANIFSGNLLIDKQTFFDNNFPLDKNYYGLDIYMAYTLMMNNVSVTHIDNPIYHLGLEPDEVFFRKSLEAVAVRKKLLAGKPGAGSINSLLKYHQTLKKWKLCGAVSAVFRLVGPFLKKRILYNKAALIWLDIYRLGYICHIKD